MRPTWGPPGAARIQVGPMLASWTSLSGVERTSKLLTARSFLRTAEISECAKNSHRKLSYEVKRVSIVLKYGFSVQRIQYKGFSMIYMHMYIHITCCDFFYNIWFIMMTSSNGNIFRVTGHLRGEFTGPRWIPRTKASDAELRCFLWSASEQTNVRVVIWDAIAPIMTSP